MQEFEKGEIVCVSYHAPPLNSAESLCTIRLLTALIQYGYRVHLITTNHSRTLDRKIVEELTHSAIKITKVNLPTFPKLKKAFGIFRFFLHSYRVEWGRSAIAETRKILSHYPDPPILLTRATPIVSNVVGFYCRDLAKLWVPHLSDPFPPYEWKEHWYSSFARPLNFRWARRFVTQSSMISVTCKNAVRYVCEKLRIQSTDKFHVLPHLAFPSIQVENYEFPYRKNEFVLGHFGNLMERRNPHVLLKGIEKAAQQYPDIRFLQYGHVDENILKAYRESNLGKIMTIRNIENLSPGTSAYLQRKVNINIIIDTDLGLDYSPFLLSKFPHSVCSGQPMLMLSHENSAMNDYSQRFGGGICASFRESDSVANAICKLYESNQAADKKFYPSKDFMKIFGAKKIIPPFVERITQSVPNLKT